MRPDYVYAGFGGFLLTQVLTYGRQAVLLKAEFSKHLALQEVTDTEAGPIIVPCVILQ